MARVTNYDKRLDDLKAKIDKKQDELKKLQDQLKGLRMQQDKKQIDALLTAIQGKGLTISTVLEWVNNYGK